MPVKTVGDVVKDTFDNTFFKNPLKVEWKTKSLHSNEQFSSGAWGSTHGEMSCTATVKCRSNGLKLPLLGLGTSQFPSDEVLKDAINCALETGYRHFDTAFSFENEVPIGEVIDEWIQAGKIKRSELFITTKVPH